MSAQTATGSTTRAAAREREQAAPERAGAAAPTGVSGLDPAVEEVIAHERTLIDQLDARIITLVQERMEISEHIQQTRLSAGGRRVHLSREMEILDHYRADLGKPGTELAMTLLGLCRGSR